MIRPIRSLFAGLRAARRLGRAYLPRDHGSKAQAIGVAREALGLLSAPYVNRSNPPEGSALVGATVLVEELAHDLRVAGAPRSDISDSLAYLKRLAGSGTELERWIPYLEQRLSKETHGAV